LNLSSLRKATSGSQSAIKQHGNGGAIYLAVYVIPFASKARVCQFSDLDEYPEKRDGFKIHLYKDFSIGWFRKEIERKKR